MKYINCAELKRGAKSGAKIIDLRESVNFNSGHIPGALNIPPNEISKKTKKLCKNKNLILYCQTSGPTTRYAATVLKKIGFNNILILQYGYEGWLLEKELTKRAN